MREPTEIENGIIERVFKKMTQILSDAWKDIADIKTTMEKLETNSQFVQLVSPNEAVALVTFNTKIGKTEGMVNICLPHITLEPVISKLSTRIWLSTSKREQSETTKKFITDKVCNMKTEIRAELGKARITVGEFINLTVGDVIALDKSIRDGTDIYVKDQLKYSGVIGAYHNKLAVKVQKVIREGDRVNG